MKRYKRIVVVCLALATLTACGGSGGGRSADGIVARLTGDDDSQVPDALEDLVERAFAVPAAGHPIDD
jgi:hypothetical protein